MLILVRHGESAGNRAGLLLGRMESPLTDSGSAQAAALAGRFPSLGRVVSSPLGRARATALALAGDLPLEFDDRWLEVDYGELDGTRLADVPADLWKAWRADPGFRPPGGETLLEMGERVRGACRELFAEDGAGARAGTDVVVVSHVSPIKAAVAWALGLGDELAWRLHLSTASVTRIGWGHDGPVLHQFNG